MKIIAGILISILLTNTARCEWTILEHVRTLNHKSALEDIDKQLQEGHIYSDSDKVTFAHETTHGVNSRIRKLFNRPNGYYLLKRKAFVINSPKITLRDIANAIPREKRGSGYQLYLVQQQQYWNDVPLYVLDELVSYTNGCIVALEYNLMERGTYSFKKVLEMWEYAKVAQELSRHSRFSEQKELDNFLKWFYNNRILWIAKQYKLRGWN